MTVPASNFLTLSLDNKWGFTCPVFSAEVQMRSCVLVREKVYRGERFETRKGCQAVVRLGKCPAAEIVRRMAFNDQSASDSCASETETTGKLPADVLEKVGAVLIEERDLRAYELDAVEQDLILTSTTRIHAQMGGAPTAKVAPRGGSATKTRRSVSPKATAPAAPAAPKTPETSSVVAAARSGNLAAAVNEGE